jgi:hypothetical protein
MSPLFRLVFLSVLLLTCSSGLVAVCLAVSHDPSPNQQALFEAMTTTWKMGLGAIIGLLGGKTA